MSGVAPGEQIANGSQPSSNESRDEFSILVYECSLCAYRTVNKSNLNTHIKIKCMDAVTRKRRGIVRVLDIEDDKDAPGCSKQPVPEHVAEENNHRRLRAALADRVPVEDTDERVTFFMYTDEGRRVMLDIFSKSSLIDQFLSFIQYYAGNRAPIKCRSIVKYGSKGKSLAVVREREITYPRLRRCVIVDLLIELYSKFMVMCTQPSFRSDVPNALKIGAEEVIKMMEKPIDRPNRQRALNLAKILDTRRTDDDVMAVLIDQFPACLSFVDL